LLLFFIFLGINILVKEHDYFEDGKASIPAMEAVLNRLEQYFEAVDEPDSMQTLRAMLEECFVGDQEEGAKKSAAKALFEEQVTYLGL
jgi:hypothetical protein